MKMVQMMEEGGGDRTDISDKRGLWKGKGERGSSDSSEGMRIVERGETSTHKHTPTLAETTANRAERLSAVPAS